MTCHDVFNGDADGICALVQMRRAQPRTSHLVTGVKRHINLLAEVDARAGDEVLVLDISHDVNRQACAQLLDQGVHIRYFDHHFAGDLPVHRNFDAHIDTAPEVCTALLVDRYLGGRFPAWAITAAFGDNLAGAAHERAAAAQIAADDLQRLALLGTCINYNGYGAAVADLHFPPAELYGHLSRFDHPLEFLAADRDIFDRLHRGYQDDLAHADSATVLLDSPAALALGLPDAPWSRRVSGVHANQLAQAHPDRAHAILTDCGEDQWLVSVRAPIGHPTGADVLARQFATGGGRAAAAGINALPSNDVEKFLGQFAAHWRS